MKRNKKQKLLKSAKWSTKPQYLDHTHHMVALFIMFMKFRKMNIIIVEKYQQSNISHSKWRHRLIKKGIELKSQKIQKKKFDLFVWWNEWQLFIILRSVEKNWKFDVYFSFNSTDSGWDNPFRPDGDLSREADEIVNLIKGKFNFAVKKRLTCDSPSL